MPQIWTKIKDHVRDLMRRLSRVFKVSILGLYHWFNIEVYFLVFLCKDCVSRLAIHTILIKIPVAYA